MILLANKPLFIRKSCVHILSGTINAKSKQKILTNIS